MLGMLRPAFPPASALPRSSPPSAAAAHWAAGSRRAFAASAAACRRPAPPSGAPKPRSEPPCEVAFAFDIDGVLKTGAGVIPAALKALDIVRGANKYHRPLPHIFLTNGGGSKEAARAELLQRNFGGEIEPEQVVLSHSLMKSLTALRNKDVLVIGPPRAPEIARYYGFERVHTPDMLQQWAPSSWTHSQPPALVDGAAPTPDYSKVHFAAVLVFHDNNDWGRSLQYIVDLCRSDKGVFGTLQAGIRGPHTAKAPAEQLPLYFAHNDLIWTTEFGAPRLGLGAFRVAAQAIWREVTGRKLAYTMFGKPERATYEYADATLEQQEKELGARLPKRKVYMIGDNPASDIAGADRYGWESVLVRTGVWADSQGAPHPAPTLIADNVEEAVASALRREWGPDAV